MTEYRKNWKSQVAWLKRMSKSLTKIARDMDDEDKVEVERVARLLWERAGRIEGTTISNV